MCQLLTIIENTGKGKCLTKEEIITIEVLSINRLSCRLLTQHKTCETLMLCKILEDIWLCLSLSALLCIMCIAMQHDNLTMQIVMSMLKQDIGSWYETVNPIILTKNRRNLCMQGKFRKTSIGGGNHWGGNHCMGWEILPKTLSVNTVHHCIHKCKMKLQWKEKKIQINQI